MKTQEKVRKIKTGRNVMVSKLLAEVGVSMIVI